jgi:type IV pilus assembly protein PilC
MNFTYQARDERGKIREGEIMAGTADEAMQQLRHESLYLTSLEENTRTVSKPSPQWLRRRVPRAEIIYFTNQLAVMVDAGIPVAEALAGLANNTENPTLKEILHQIQRGVEGGENFSDAIGRFPKQFDNTYVNLVKASEASGALGHMLDRISIQSRNELETLQKVRGAMMYPALMLLMCVGVSIFLLTYVFPKLTPMFAARRIAVPTPTKIMMFLSEALTHQWYLFVLGTAAFVGLIVYVRRQHWGRQALDWMWIRMPILGPMLRKVAISRSLRTLATTINAGVPTLEALQLCAGVTNNVFFERCWLNVSERVAGGKQIHESLETETLFPRTLVQMIASGEATGRLGDVLTKVSDYYDREVAQAVKTATSMVEPLMVTVMGGVIGTIALAMLLPIFKLSGHTG